VFAAAVATGAGVKKSERLRVKNQKKKKHFLQCALYLFESAGREGNTTYTEMIPAKDAPRA